MGPVSTITQVLEENDDINNEIVRRRNPGDFGIYKRFFETVRANKESGDNFGEEILAICLHILSHIPGEDDGKFCVMTDDKGAASKIDAMFKKTAKQYRGKEVGIFSTPKLVQVLYREKILFNKEDLIEILGVGTNGNIVILGMMFY